MLKVTFKGGLYFVLHSFYKDAKNIRCGLYFMLFHFSPLVGSIVLEHVYCRTLNYSHCVLCDLLLVCDSFFSNRSEKLRWMCALTPNRRTRFMSTSAHQPGETYLKTTAEDQNSRFSLTFLLTPLTTTQLPNPCFLSQTLLRSSAFSHTPLRNQTNCPLRWPTCWTFWRGQTTVGATLFSSLFNSSI